MEKHSILCACNSAFTSYEKASEILQNFIVGRPSISTAEDETSVITNTINLEVALLVRHHKPTELLLSQLASCSHYVTPHVYLTCIARHLGGAAALLVRYDEARKYYQEAIKACT
jgi:hypothetical protein